MELRTARLLLRRWRPEDLAPFAELNADPDVTRYLAARLTRAESDELVARIEAGFEEHGWGLWAVEVVESARFIGFVGLWPTWFEAAFTPAVEVGWRLARASWGSGYATEAGRAALECGHGPVGLGEIVSFTAATNLRSRAVMERLGLTRDPADDFDHPTLPVGSPLRRHVLYRSRRDSGPVVS